MTPRTLERLLSLKGAARSQHQSPPPIPPPLSPFPTSKTWLSTSQRRIFVHRSFLLLRIAEASPQLLFPASLSFAIRLFLTVLRSKSPAESFFQVESSIKNAQGLVIAELVAKGEQNALALNPTLGILSSAALELDLYPSLPVLFLSKFSFS